MSTFDIHRPTAEFRERLEWELTRTLRRERRLTGHRRARTLRRLRTAGLLAASVALGATAGLASAQIRDDARRDSLLEAAQAELVLAGVRLDLARAQLIGAQRKVQLGASGPASLAAADAEHRAMEAQVRRAQLNIEEIQAAAQPPRDELNAPLVDNRDFVSERLRLDLLAAQQRLTASEQAYAEAERRGRVGAGSEVARLEAEMEVTRARAAMAALAERQNLRREFLEKSTPIEQLLRRQERALVRQELLVGQRGLAIARERLALVEKRRATGAAGELDVLKAQVEVREREIELQALIGRLRQIEAGPAPPSE